MSRTTAKILALALLAVAAAGGVAWWLTREPVTSAIVAGLVAVAIFVPLGLAVVFSTFRRRRAESGLGRELARDLGRKFVGGLRRIGGAKIGLYELPWYLLVGEAGAGKTEALRHANICPAGLNDPRQGAGGTTNMDWWFARGAVLLDTAGRLMFEDTPEWHQFLRLLKKHRSRRPINGMVLAIPATSLQSDPADAIARKAAKIAEQLDTVQRELGVRFPVYVLVTKADLIPGWREYFAGLTDPRQQNQMVGWSNPDDLDQPFRPELVGRYLGALRRSLRRRRLELLRDPPPLDPERDRRADRVDGLFALPDNLTGIVPRLQLYLETVFMPSEWSTKPLFLRGLYFTQAMADGSVLDTDLAEAFGTEPREVPERRHAFARDRTFFLKDVFLEKIFPESGLVTGAANVARSVRRRKLMVGASGLAAVLAVAAGTALAYQQLRDSIGGPLAFWKAVEARRAAGEPLDLSGDAGADLLGLHEENLDGLRGERVAMPALFRPAAAVVGDASAEARDAHERFLREHTLAPVVRRAANALARGAGDPSVREKLLGPLAATAAAADGAGEGPSLASLWAGSGGRDLGGLLPQAQASLEGWPAAVAGPGTPARRALDEAVRAAAAAEREDALAGAAEAQSLARTINEVAAAVEVAQGREAAFLRDAADADADPAAWNPRDRVSPTGVPSRGLNPADPAAGAARMLARSTEAAGRLTGSAVSAEAQGVRDDVRAAAAALDAAVAGWDADAAADQLSAGDVDPRARRFALYAALSEELRREPEASVASLADAPAALDAAGGLAEQVGSLRGEVLGAARSESLRRPAEAALDRLAGARLDRELDAAWSAVADVLPADLESLQLLAPGTPPEAARVASASKAIRDVAARAAESGPRDAAVAARVKQAVARVEAARTTFVENAAAAWERMPAAEPRAWDELDDLYPDRDAATAAVDSLVSAGRQRGDALRTLAPELPAAAGAEAARRAEKLAENAAALEQRKSATADALSAWAALARSGDDPLAARRAVLAAPAEYDLAAGLAWDSYAYDALDAVQTAARRSLQAAAAAAFDARVEALRDALGFPLIRGTGRTMSDADLAAFADGLERLGGAPANRVGALRPGGDRYAADAPALAELRELSGRPAALQGRTLRLRVIGYAGGATPNAGLEAGRYFTVVKNDAGPDDADGRLAGRVGTSDRERALTGLSLADDRVKILLGGGGGGTITLPVGDAAGRYSLLAAVLDESLWPGGKPPTDDGRQWRLWLPVGERFKGLRLEVVVEVEGDDPLPLPGAWKASPADQPGGE